jgi:hypothetical protein
VTLGPQRFLLPVTRCLLPSHPSRTLVSSISWRGGWARAAVAQVRALVLQAIAATTEQRCTKAVARNLGDMERLENGEWIIWRCEVESVNGSG